MNPFPSLRRVGALLGKEFLRGPRNYMFIMAVAVPIVMTLAIQLLFGSLFSGQPRLGIVDEGRSRLVGAVEAHPAVSLSRYGTAGELRAAVAAGAVDMGLVLPAGFDNRLVAGEISEVTAYLWGQSLLQDRLILGTTLAVLLRETAGQESPVEIVTTALGNGESVPWEERLLPFVVLIAIIFGGSMVPATSLVEEKQQGTLKALTVTPLSLGELFAAKGIVGFILGLVMGALILLLNDAFGRQPGLLLLLLALGASMSAIFGILLGAVVKDINTLFATIKGLGILLYAPALVELFPQIPAWIGQIFPTYYMIEPVLAVAQEGAGWAEVSADIGALVIINLLLIGLVALVIYAERTGRPGPLRRGTVTEAATHES